MASLMLLFVGSAYLLNGLTMLGRIEPEGSAAMNLFVGGSLSLVTVAFVLGLPAPVDGMPLGDVIGLIGYPLFAFTFLYVGINNYTGHDGNGLGWYCGWSALVSAGLSLSNVFILESTSGALLWFVWTVVFAAFFMTIVLKQSHLERAVGRFVVLAGFTTCVIPASAQMLGIWSDRAPLWVYVMLLGTVAYLVFEVLRADRQISAKA